MTHQLIGIPSSIGKLSAVIHQPQTESDRLAILCPGFCDSKDYAGLVGLANALCGRGYTVVRFDPTGIWDSDGDIVDYTTTQYLIDIRAVLDFMLSQREYRHVLLGGHSRGAAVAIEYATQDQRVSAVLAVMPSSGRWLTPEQRAAWQTNGKRPTRRDLPRDPEQFRVYNVPYSFQEDRDRYDTIAAANRLHIPILFVAGETDTIVSPADVQAVFDRANEPKRLIVVPAIGHDYRHHLNEVQLVNQLILEQSDLLE